MLCLLSQLPRQTSVATDNEASQMSQAGICTTSATVFAELLSYDRLVCVTPLICVSDVQQRSLAVTDHGT